jgi:hypothetical protein
MMQGFFLCNTVDCFFDFSNIEGFSEVTDDTITSNINRFVLFIM